MQRREIEMVSLQAGYGLDRDGYIFSDVALDKIDNVYFPCIRESVEKIARLFPHLLNSIYVYGSVARGKAVVAKSDLDLLAMFNGTLSAEELAHLKIILKHCLKSITLWFEMLA
jgi:predicted nucleotidyltransferase